MIITAYQKDIKWKRMKCQRCGQLRWCCQHHIDRRQNSDRVVWICSNGYTSTPYPDSCHDWIEQNIGKAIEEGYYCHFDSTYRKKSSDPSKWKLKKKIGI